MAILFVLRLVPSPVFEWPAGLVVSQDTKARRASGKPASTGPASKYDAAGGRWVTVHGHPVYIRPSSGGHEAIRAGKAEAPDISPSSASPGNDAVRAWGHGREALAFFQGGDPDLKDLVPSEQAFNADPAKATARFYDTVSSEMGARGRAKNALVTDIAKTSGLPYDEVNGYVRDWTHIGPDYLNKTAMQMAATQEFGGTMSRFWAEPHQRHWTERQAEVKRALKDYGPDAKVTDSLSEHLVLPHERYTGTTLGEAAKMTEPDLTRERKFLRAMYDNTQRELSKLPGDSVIAFRTVNHVDSLGLTGSEGQPTKVRMNKIQSPMASWSLSERAANVFGANLFMARIPKKRILGTARTGFGALMEEEFVVLGGHPADEAWYIPNKGRGDW